MSNDNIHEVALIVGMGMQTWDVNKAAPESLGGPFNLMLASNAVHTCDNMAGEPALPCPKGHLLSITAQSLLCANVSSSTRCACV